jgi:hypothetical protein
MSIDVEQCCPPPEVMSRNRVYGEPRKRGKRGKAVLFLLLECGVQLSSEIFLWYKIHNDDAGN